METIAGLGYSVGSFLLLLTVLVFVHEMGHYLVARWNGVRVEVFSIGFGPEVFGRNDSHGTRWKFSWIPLGGYVKMFGETDDADAPPMTPAESAVSFHGKSVGRRAAIVFAGPGVNYVFAVVVWAFLFVFVGENFTPAEVSAVQPGSAAEAAGIQAGDRITRIDGRDIARFEDIQQIVRLNPGSRIEVVVERDKRELALIAVPKVSDFTDNFGNVHRVGLLGVTHHLAPVIGQIGSGTAAERAGLMPGDRVLSVDGQVIERFDQLSTAVASRPAERLALEIERQGKRLVVDVVPEAVAVAGKERTQSVGRLGVGPKRGERLRHGPIAALGRAVNETWAITQATFTAVGQMFVGARTTDELGGPIKIAQMSGQMAQGGAYSFFWFMAFISLNLCIINLFPVPMLDGGHLLYYAIECARGKPLGQRAQEYGFRIGLALVLGLMVFVTWNDLVNLRVFEFMKDLVS